MEYKNQTRRVVLITLIISTFFFFIGFVIVLFLYIRQSANLIAPEDCAQIVRGSWEVIAAQTGDILQTCEGPCVFQAPTLLDAINRCELAGTFQCNVFTWSALTEEVSFVNNVRNDPNLTGNVYFRQVVI